MEVAVKILNVPTTKTQQPHFELSRMRNAFTCLCTKSCVPGCRCKAANWGVTPVSGRLKVVTASIEQGMVAQEVPWKTSATKKIKIDLCTEAGSSQLELELGRSSFQKSLGF